MSDQKIINNWLYAFARDVDKQKLSDHVLSYGNFLWHVFSYEYVTCLEGDKARAEFDRISYDKAIRFHDGYGGQITAVKTVKPVLHGKKRAVPGAGSALYSRTAALACGYGCHSDLRSFETDISVSDDRGIPVAS